MQDHAASKAEAQEAADANLCQLDMIERMGGWGDGQELLTPAQRQQAAEVRRRLFGVRLRGTRCAPSRRVRGRAAPRRRRTSSSSRTSSCDPGGDDDPELSPPLAVAPPPRATLTYGHLTADQRGEAS